MELIKKGLMVHYLLESEGDYTVYKSSIESNQQEFKHIFFPSLGRDGVEILVYPEYKFEDIQEKTVL